MICVYQPFFKPPPPVGAGGGYMFSGRPSVRASVRDSRGSFMFLRYLLYLLTDFRQTFVTGASRDRDELIRFWGQKIKGQGHGMTEYIPDFYVSAISPQCLLTDFRQTFVTGASWVTGDLITVLVKRSKFKVTPLRRRRTALDATVECHRTRRYRRVQVFLVIE